MTLWFYLEMMVLPYLLWRAGQKGLSVLPRTWCPMSDYGMVRHALGGDYTKARKLHLENYSLFTDLFCEPNPVPVKVLMQMSGMIQSAEVRLPLCPPSSKNLDLLKGIAAQIKLTENICS